MSGERVLIVGSGAREHAIAAALSRSSGVPELVCFGSSNNPGISGMCEHYGVGAMKDADAIARFAREHQATLAIIGPEAPLAAGAADALWAANIPVVGPTRSLAQIESSKGFTRELLGKYSIPGNPAYERFTSAQDARSWLARFPEAHVIKDDGLAGGKGVKVYGDHLRSLDESFAFCAELERAGRPFVLEEKLEGEEFSLMSFADGQTLRHMPAVQDHKRAYDGDTGPNTGGMGTYTDANGSLPFLKASDLADAASINEQVAAALARECGEPYRGILYGGFMATRDGVRLIEYNARFGDPEALNLLTLLESDFLTLCRAITNGTLAEAPLQFARQATVCKYLVPEGYPDAPRVDDPVRLPEAFPENTTVYLGAVDGRNGELLATGSRTLAVVGRGGTLPLAEERCQAAARQIGGRFNFRSDIGTAALINKRISHMEALRGQ